MKLLIENLFWIIIIIFGSIYLIFLEIERKMISGKRKQEEKRDEDMFTGRSCKTDRKLFFDIYGWRGDSYLVF
ncbi:hypothetical protein, partial [Romboutsia timonensis]|uniref:hypothetical protein n=1 Tax=Romboutsia timonensis TaxID=1776391 RepID=UPI00248BAC32